MKNITTWIIPLSVIVLGILSINGIYTPSRMSEGSGMGMLLFGIFLVFLTPYLNYLDGQYEKKEELVVCDSKSEKKGKRYYICSFFSFLGVLYFVGYLFEFFTNVWVFIFVVLTFGICDKQIQKIFNS